MEKNCKIVYSIIPLFKKKYVDILLYTLNISERVQKKQLHDRSLGMGQVVKPGRWLKFSVFKNLLHVIFSIKKKILLLKTLTLNIWNDLCIL